MKAIDLLNRLRGVHPEAPVLHFDGLFSEPLMVTHDDGSLVFVSDRPLLLQAAAEPRLHGNYRDPSQWSEPVTGDDTIDANVELFTRLEELTQRNEKLEKEIAALLALAPAPGVPAADTAPVVADTVPVVTAPDTGGTPVLPSADAPATDAPADAPAPETPLPVVAADAAASEPKAAKKKNK